MGKRTKRWRSLCRSKEVQGRAVLRRLTRERADARAEADRLRKQLAQRQELNCFRLAVERLPFGRVGGDVYAARVTFDPRMVEYGLFRAGGDPVNVSRHLRFLAEELAERVERELAKQVFQEAGGLSQTGPSI